MNDCCKDKSNRVVVPISEDRSCDVCRSCGARHFRMQADPGIIGLRGRDLGPTNEPDLELKITMSDEGAISVLGPIENKVLAYGMLEMAKKVIKEHHKRVKSASEETVQ
jgi:hypothetical protein